MKRRLKVAFDKGGGVRKVECDGMSLALAGRGGFEIEEVLVPDGTRKAWGPVEGTIRRRGSALRFEGAIPQAGLELSADIRQDDSLALEGEVRDLTGQDRALNVSFTLPVNLRGWQWENTAFTRARIVAGATYPSARKDFLYLGKKGDGFRDEDHAVYGIRTNKLPFSCVTRGRAGLALAYPVHEPRVFLIEARDRGYTITFSLGLMPDSRRNPSRASFRFIAYAADAVWGIRSAAERYQGFFPDLFQSHARRHGNIASFFNPDRVSPRPDADKMGYAYSNQDYQWSNGEMSESMAALAKKLDVEVFHWRGPWYSFHEAPGDIAPDAQLALLKAQSEGRAPGAHGKNNQLCGCPDDLSARAMYHSALINDRNKIERVFFAYPQYGCWLLPMNMDPNLPQPNRYTLAMDWQYRYIRRWREKNFRGPRNFAWDASDDFSGFRRLNFRRDHLTVMDLPATFDPASGRVCQVKGFHDWRFAKDHSDQVRKAGGMIMANANLEHSMMYAGACMDVVFRERRLRDHDEERLSVHRMLLGAKPIAFQGGHREAKSEKSWRAAAEKALLFGMAPGKSGHVLLLGNTIRVLKRMGAAGWRPVPLARAKGLLIERYGDRPAEMLWAIRNPGPRPVRSRLVPDATLCQPEKDLPPMAWLLPEAAAQPWQRTRDGQWTLPLRVEGKQTVVLGWR